MNEMPVQDWFVKNISGNLSRIWWLPVLFISMTFLGINTFVCMINRIRILLTKKNEIPLRKFFHLLTPSLIHGLFIIILFGHFITFTAGEWQRTNIREGMVVKIDNSGEVFNVKSISNKYYPDNSLLKQRIRNTEVKLLTGNGTALNIQHLNPKFYNGKHIFLDMKKNKKESKLKDLAVINSSETCNKAEHYHQKKIKPGSTLQLRTVYDPGLPIILVGFLFILILMLWYYIETGKKESQVQ